MQYTQSGGENDNKTGNVPAPVVATVVANHANMAGNSSHSTSMSSFWIIDFGATDHMTLHKEWLFDIRLNDSSSRVVLLPNGTQCKVTHIGSC